MYDMEVDKIKKTIFIGLTLLFVGGGFVVFAQNSNESTNNIFQDFDQDGLSNDEEAIYGTDIHNRDTDGDGYSDYTEVSSGYDPLKPAPGDKIILEESVESTSLQLNDIQDSDNLTQKAASQIASVVSTGDMENLEITVENIDDLVQEALSSGVGDVTLQEINVDDIKIKEQEYKKLTDEEREKKIQEDTEEYLTAITYIFSTNAPDDTASYGNLSSWLESNMRKISSAYTSGDYSYIEELSVIGENMLGQLQELEVPENMLNIHIKGLQLSYYALEMKDTGEPNSEDPLKNIVSLSRAQGLVTILMDYMLEVENAVYETGMESISAEEFDIDFLEESE